MIKPGAPEKVSITMTIFPLFMNARYLFIVASLIVLVCTMIAGCTSPSGGSSGYQNPPAATPVITAANTPTGPSSGVATAPVTVTTPAAPGPVVTVDLIAKNMAFNTSTITVPASSQVVIRFQNQEASGSSQVAGIPHNFALYQSPNSTVSIFSGDIITGGENSTYTFVAPVSPGTYFFRCNVHPTTMKGQFIVT